MSVDLVDGRTISVPLEFYPTLLHATTAQRRKWRTCCSGCGISWPDLDEDISVGGLLDGDRDLSAATRRRFRRPATIAR